MIILTILNILGFIVFGLIFLFATIFLLALFCKFRYDIKVDKANLEAEWVYSVRATWFLGIFKLIAKNNQEPQFKLAGVAINLGGDKESDEIEEKPPKSPLEEVNGRFEKARKATAAKRRKIKLKGRFDGIRNSLKLLDEIDIKGILAALWNAAKGIFSKIKPKKLRIHGKIGLDEPDKTGMAIAGISAASALGFDIYIQGDFEEKALELDIHAAGGFRLWSFTQIALKTWRKPEIKQLYEAVRTRHSRESGNPPSGEARKRRSSPLSRR
ncbi:MAG: hypothetical protein LBE35_08570 [Clostridiales bacterium]|nr:hypothetical protein [Clostridiales bacterium]